MYHEKIDCLLDTYARKLAENYNENFEIQTRCPSILVAGRANFPIRKKEKQNAASDRNTEAFCRIQGLLNKIRSTGMGGVSSDDGNAIVKLKANLESRERAQEEMKAVNAYYRKNGTLQGCPLLTPEDIAKLEAEMARSFRWAPSQGAWQRMLNRNGICAARQVTEAWMPRESEQAVVEEPETAPSSWSQQML